ELRLLDLLGDDARVLEENEDRCGLGTAERGEMGLNDASAIERDETLRELRLAARTVPPALEQVEQPRRGFPENRAGVSCTIAENLCGGLVDEPDSILGVD